MQPLNHEALQAAKKSLRIREVYFRDERVILGESATPPFWSEPAHTQFKMSTKILRDFELTGEEGQEVRRVHFLEVEFLGAVRCLTEAPEGSEGRELLSMEISIGLLYEMREPCADESIDEFIRMNVPFHAIPYWREHVHSVCAKRRFRQITVPLYTKAIHLMEPKDEAETVPEPSAIQG